MPAEGGAVLTGKKALVTGGGRGLGLAIAGALAAAGAEVRLTDLSDELLDSGVHELKEDGFAVAGTYAADLSDTDAIVAMADEVTVDAGAIDILVNNAGIRHIAPVLDYDLARWQQSLAINLTAPFLLSQHFARQMADGDGGSIINIASVAGVSAFDQRVGYNSTKAGVIMMTRAMAFELGGRGVRCNAVAPGVVETPLTRDYFRDPDTAARIVGQTPMARWGEPREIAEPVVFLASDSASYMNGTVTVIDGGWTSGKSF